MAVDWNNKNLCREIMLPGGTKVSTFEPPKILGMEADMIIIDDTYDYDVSKELFNGLINYIRNADTYRNMKIKSEQEQFNVVTNIHITVTIPTSVFNGMVR